MARRINIHPAYPLASADKTFTIQHSQLIKLIAREDVRDFMERHRDDDVQQLALRYSGKVDFDIAAIAQQIALRQKAKNKIPGFLQAETILLPKLFEQSTHEQVARYKATLIRGKTLLDATTGLGVDVYFIGRNFDSVLCLEADQEVAEIAKHNFEGLNFKARVIHSTLEDFLEKNSEHFDTIYIDPDRRSAGKREQYDIGLSTPDITSLQEKLLDQAASVWIKLSPMADMNEIIRIFSGKLSMVIGIAYQNELKELLVCLRADHGSATIFSATNISNLKTETCQSEDLNAVNKIAEAPYHYFFEPNVALIKTRLAFAYAREHELELLYPNGYYFTMKTKPGTLQGRSFEVMEAMPYKIEKLKQFISTNRIRQANIASRNFFWKPDEIRSQLKLKDGGEWYLFCYNDFNKDPVAVWCKRVMQ